jgi:hypothetical protein
MHFRRCLAASAFLFVIYAIFFTGYLHGDEYFQTVEFASSKLGITNTADLPWEYPEKMRSWLQPAFYVVVGEAAQALGIDAPWSCSSCFGSSRVLLLGRRFGL